MWEKYKKVTAKAFCYLSSIGGWICFVGSFALAIYWSIQFGKGEYEFYEFFLAIILAALVNFLGLGAAQVWVKLAHLIENESKSSNNLEKRLEAEREARLQKSMNTVENS